VLAFCVVVIALVVAEPPVPDGWVETCSYKHKHFFMTLDHPPTDDEDQRIREERKDAMMQALSGVQKDVQKKQAHCEREFSAFRCFRSLYARLRHDFENGVHNSFDLAKHKYISYLRVFRMGHENQLAHIDEYYRQEEDDLKTRICDHRRDFWFNQLFVEDGKHYKAMHKIFFHSNDEESFNHKKRTFMEDMNVFTGNYCVLPKLFMSHIQEQLNNVKHKVVLQPMADTAIVSGLSKAQIVAARKHASDIVKLLWETCHPENDQMARDFHSCSLVHDSYSVHLPQSNDLFGLCRTVLAESSLNQQCGEE